MVKKGANSALGQIDQQELQHLITVSTGFIDAYIIQCHQKVPMLLPQNIVLSAMDTQTNVDHIEWHDLKLPVYAVNDPNEKQGVALVIEGDDVSERFALVCKGRCAASAVSMWTRLASQISRAWPACPARCSIY